MYASFLCQQLSQISLLHIAVGMASKENTTCLGEWEIFENGSEESETNVMEGEEAAIGFYEDAWEKSCDKLKTDPDYHKTYIPIADILSFPTLSETDQEAFVKERRLSGEDKAFLTSEKGLKCLEDVSKSVVHISVTLAGGRKAVGTGFFVIVNNSGVAVITNSHTLRKASSEGVDFRFVKPEAIKITCFHDGKSDGQMQYGVKNIQLSSRPEKNREDEALLKRMRQNLAGDESKNLETIGNCRAAVEKLAAYFNKRDAFLDYALLYLKPPDNDELKLKIKSLEMKPFQILENFRNVSSFGFPDPSSSKYPRSLRLFSVSHPHGHSKMVSFGGMESCIQHVYFLSMTYGQNDTGMLGGKEPFVVHSVTSCKGCSGAPVFFYMFNHETGEVETDAAAYFIHFFGIPVDEDNNKLQGKAVSFATIIKHQGYVGLHNELAEAFAEVREYEGDAE